MFANGPGDRGSIPGRVIPKTEKTVLDAALLSTQHYKVWIKGKVEQSWELSSALPLHLGVVAIEKGAFGSPSSKVANFALLTKSSIQQVLFLFIYLFIYLFILLTITRSGRMAGIRWSVCISKFQRILCISFSRMDSGLCIYYLFVWSNLNLLHNSPWITFPAQSYLVLYFFR